MLGDAQIFNDRYSYLNRTKHFWGRRDLCIVCKKVNNGKGKKLFTDSRWNLTYRPEKNLMKNYDGNALWKRASIW